MSTREVRLRASEVVVARSREELFLQILRLGRRQVHANAERQKLVRQTLAKLELPVESQLVARVCDELGEDADTLTEAEMLQAFERGVPIVWRVDLQHVTAEQTLAFAGDVLAILAARTPAQLPLQVTATVVAALEHRIGAALDPERDALARRSLEELFVHTLWQCKDGPAQEALTEAVLFGLRNRARLVFAGLGEFGAREWLPPDARRPREP